MFAALEKNAWWLGKFVTDTKIWIILSYSVVTVILNVSAVLFEKKTEYVSWRICKEITGNISKNSKIFKIMDQAEKERQLMTSLGLIENFGESAYKTIYYELWWNMCKINPGATCSFLRLKKL